MFGVGGRGAAKAARAQVQPERATGKIIEWKNKYGWIIPHEPVAHPEATKRGGKVYLSQEDVEEVISGVGAEVSFYIYADGSGLGAMNCVPAESNTAKEPPKPPKGTVAPSSKAPPVTPSAKKKSTPGRKRVSDVPINGKVKKWQSTFGFITPAEPVDHPLFTGSLFLNASDVLNASASDMEAGKQVSFYLYADPQGLGAEDCTVLDGDAEPVVAVELHESSTLLKARPKGAAAPPVRGGGVLAPKPKSSAPMKPTPKAAAGVRASDPDLAAKMAESPELARRLSAWMFDPGG